MIGCGVNGAETARMFRALGGDVQLWDIDPARAAFVADRLGATVASSQQEALESDIVVTVTPGRELLYPDGSLRDGQHVSMMGADGPGKAEVAVGELARADLFCDDWEQASHGGELAAGVVAGLVTRDRVTDIGRVLSGDAEGRRSAATSRCSTRPASRSRILRSPRSRPRRPISWICSARRLSGTASHRWAIRQRVLPSPPARRPCFHERLERRPRPVPSS